ncbi:ABC transporter ATP-binding protein [Aequorivita lipolytica]|uniref:ABC transporter ATP-binding protein n=1 Tax=Aequorivita lipolytica TaxID=153267 RepID=A0A5C6YN33_9FLAO|nr:ABC transporter ATP-binding protein [Aequorivita lipolytica]TXD68738.1 ABC transporter ATP-binding protein [Aequorivita lipolytica]SRX53118.1 Putative multidrug export ATP-binding/permease protein [Aequorivita lipolytica]
MARPQPKSISDKEKKTSVKDSFKALKTIPRFFREIYRSSPKLFLLNALSRLINAFTPVVILWVGKMIIDEIILQVSLPDKDFTLLWNYVIIEFSVAVLSDLLGRLINLTDGLLGDLYSNMSSEKIIRKTAELTIAQLEDPEFYDKLERARTQTNSRVDLMTNALGQAESLISMVSLIAGLVYFEPILILILIVSIIPSFINEAKFSSTRYSLARSWTAERRELDYLRFIGANNQTAKEIKLFGLTDFIAERFKGLSNDYYLINKKLSLKQSFYGSLFNILGVLSYYGAYVYIILRVLTGVITIGELTFLSGSFNRLRNNLQGFFSRFTRISESALYLQDYFDFIDLTVEQTSEAKTPMPKTITQGFQVNNLHFAYAGSETEVLKGVTFTLNAGEKMAFVGQNGAGKTTLIKLFLRFYEPTQGEILLDGININKFDVDAYRKRFGVIFQDFFKYEFTLRENIAVGNIDQVANDEVISYAASKSLAEQVVSEMADGLEQRLGRRFYKGTELSGGQWQKVALARAYMKDADVMVLDEPTSALDAQAEFDVFERFIALTKGKTSIIISHRFSTVRMADRILVLQNGQVLELGTHEQLMAQPKLYAELFKLQAAGYQ